MVCIVDGNGSNELVEKKRGKLFRDAVLPEESETASNGAFAAEGDNAPISLLDMEEVDIELCDSEEWGEL